MRARLKLVCGLIFTVMALGELATGFLAFPSVVDYAETRIEWWAEYMPVVMLLNSLLASVLLMFGGVKMMNKGLLLTSEQERRLFRRLFRWLEKRKYGYYKSDYIISK